MDSETSGIGIVAGILLVALVAGILSRPGVALAIAGVLSILVGLFLFAVGGLVGPAAGVSAIVGGIVMIGLARMIVVAEEALVELRAVRSIFETRAAAAARQQAPTAPAARPTAC
jgi:hypothetical protein